MTLDQLKSEEFWLLDLLERNIDEQRKIKTASLYADYKVGIGSRIEWVLGDSRCQGVITELVFDKAIITHVLCNVDFMEGSNIFGFRKIPVSDLKTKYKVI